MFEIGDEHLQSFDARQDLRLLSIVQRHEER
jgi:hypothetical protein